MNDINDLQNTPSIRDIWTSLNENRIEQKLGLEAGEVENLLSTASDNVSISLLARGLSDIQNSISDSGQYSQNGLRSMISNMINKSDVQGMARFIGVAASMSAPDLSGFAGQAGAVGALQDEQLFQSWLDQSLSLRETDQELAESFANAANNIMNLAYAEDDPASGEKAGALRSFLTVTANLNRLEEGTESFRDFLAQVSNTENTTNLSILISQSFQRISGDLR